MYHKLKEQLQVWGKDKLLPLCTEGTVCDTITFMIHEDLKNNHQVRVRNSEELEKYRSHKN